MIPLSVVFYPHAVYVHWCVISA